MTSATSLKEELFKLKNKLETIEDQLTKQSTEIDTREKKWAKIQTNLDFVLGGQGERLKLNVGGKKFSTAVSTILSIRDSFLARLVESGKADLKEEIFIDRSPTVFHLILDYYRYKKITYKGLTKDELNLLREDAAYYAVYDISDYLEEKMKEPVIVAMDPIKEYLYKGTLAGTNKFSDLNDKDLNSGVCCNTPGKIVIELNSDYVISGLKVGGFNGNTTVWYPDNGANAKIFASVDKITWTQIGTIPSGYGKNIKKVNLTKVTNGKFIKFESNNYLGLGYVQVTKSEELFA